MPTKKKVSEKPEPVETPAEVVETAAPVNKEPAACGHVNKQHYNAKGRLEDLSCDLPDGHEGDHHAVYMRSVADPVYDDKNRLIKTDYHQEEAEAWWSNAAGVSAAPADGLEAEQTSLLQKDLIMQVMKKHPDLTAEQAIALAKKDPAWNSGSEPG